MDDDVTGISSPFRIDPTTGGVVRTTGLEKLKENIVHILLTGVGERVMRRGYGGGLRQLVHDPNNDALRAVVQHQIGKSITQAEPRVEVREVTVRQLEGGTGSGEAEAGTLTLWANVEFVVRQTGRHESVSVPFGLGGI